MINREQAIERLKELREWSVYLATVLARDEEWEPGRMEYLKAVAGDDAVDRARQEAKRLSLHLYELLVAAETKPEPQPQPVG